MAASSDGGNPSNRGLSAGSRGSDM
jgi:hypothetical protein